MKKEEIHWKECLAWLGWVAAGYRLAILLRGGLGMLQVAVSLTSVWVSKGLIDEATRGGEGLGDWVVALLLCLVGRLLLSIGGSWWAGRQELALRNDLIRRLFAHVMEGRWTGREPLHSADVLNRLAKDVGTVVGLWCHSVPAVLVLVTQLLGAFVLLYRMDARLAGLALVIMPVALLVSKSYLHRMRRLTHRIRRLDSRIQSHLQEQLQHRTLIQSLEYTPLGLERLDRWQGRFYRQVMQRTRISLFSRGVVQTGFSAGYATAFLWGVYGLQQGTVTFGMMTAFLQLVAQVQGSLVDLSRQIPAFTQAVTSVERLQELLAIPRETSGEEVRLQGPVGVRLEGVTFAYPEGDCPVLAQFSHDFVPGSLTAIVGETGAGKSTLLRLVLALLEPEQGKVVLYDGHREVTASPATRCNLSYVPQGNTLVSGTIRENLRMGNPKATDEELREALYTAAAEFVFDLPEGLDSFCSERGAGLSEGQAQRIAIARGLLRPGQVLLLDEPTSALDEVTERLLLQRLHACLDNRTLLLITHHEAVTRHCTHWVRLQRS